MLREAQQIFEAGINPFVKDAMLSMRANFGVAPDADAVAQLAAADAADAAVIRDTKLPSAEAAPVTKAKAVHKLKQRLWFIARPDRGRCD